MINGWLVPLAGVIVSVLLSAATATFGYGYMSATVNGLADKVSDMSHVSATITAVNQHLLDIDRRLNRIDGRLDIALQED